MKIGIVTSWNDNLTLFKFLNKYDNEYYIYYDFMSWPYWDRNFDDALKSIKKWIVYLKKLWVEKIIIPPIFELTIKDKNILPLFESYLLEYVFKYSLVGKIWIVWDFLEESQIQNILKDFQKKYNLTDHQRNIKKFHFPFAYRFKSVPLRKYFLVNLSYSNFLVNKTVKFDLRYFKDSNVDSIIPMNYWYFNYENVVSRYFNFNKTRFHKLEKLEECFKKLISNIWEKYSVKVFFTWHAEFIKKEKRLLRLLQRWKSVEVERSNL